MTTNAKLFLSALGFIALVANPAVATTHTQRFIGDRPSK